MAGWSPTLLCAVSKSEEALGSALAMYTFTIVAIVTHLALSLVYVRRLWLLRGRRRAAGHKGKQLVFCLGLLHAASSLLDHCGSQYDYVFLFLFPRGLGYATTTLRSESLLFMHSFAILTQMTVLKALKNPFKKRTSPHYLAAAVSVFFAAAQMACMLLDVLWGGHDTALVISSSAYFLQVGFMCVLLQWFGRILQKTLEQIEAVVISSRAAPAITGAGNRSADSGEEAVMLVSAQQRRKMVRYRQTVVPIGVLACSVILISILVPCSASLLQFMTLVVAMPVLQFLSSLAVLVAITVDDTARGARTSVVPSNSSPGASKFVSDKAASQPT
jgi:hypothetical protein